MLCIHVFHALQAANTVSCAGEEGAWLEEIRNSAGNGLGLEGVVVAEELGNEVDAMPGQISCDGEEVEQDGDGVGWVLGVLEGIDGGKA